MKLAIDRHACNAPALTSLPPEDWLCTWSLYEYLLELGLTRQHRDTHSAHLSVLPPVHTLPGVVPAPRHWLTRVRAPCSNEGTFSLAPRHDGLYRQQDAPYLEAPSWRLKAPTHFAVARCALSCGITSCCITSWSITS